MRFVPTTWLDADIARLRDAYARGGLRTAGLAFPARTRASLCQQAHRLGICRERRWTHQDDARLIDLWGEGTSLATMAARFHRTPLAVFARGKQLGLSVGVPQGFELITHAARRTGYDVKQLRQILHWARVRIRPALCEPSRYVRCPRKIVDSFEADVAVERWLETEPLSRVAKRLRLCDRTVARKLTRSGFQRRGWQYRVTEEQVKRALGIA